MSTSAFRIWLTMLAALILLSLSPLAIFGGLLVIVGLMLSYMMITLVLGDELNGQMVDGIVAASFWLGAILVTLIAVRRFYRAADLVAQGDHHRARRETAWGLSLLTGPIVIYCWCKAMPVI